MKTYGLLNGLFYIIFGLCGVLMPDLLALEAMGWKPDLLGLHQIRAMWMASIGFGIICIVMAQRGDRAALTKGIVLITLCFLSGRVIGLIVDGVGPMQTHVEIAVEAVWAGIGILLLSRNKRRRSFI